MSLLFLKVRQPRRRTTTKPMDAHDLNGRIPPQRPVVSPAASKRRTRLHGASLAMRCRSGAQPFHSSPPPIERQQEMTT